MRKTDISCRRCGYAATVEGPPPERCPGCKVGPKPDAVVEFEEKLDALRSQLMFQAMKAGWPVANLGWKKYPSSTDRLDLMHESTRLAIIRVEFEPPSIAFKWVAPEQVPMTAAESVLLGELEEAKAAQDKYNFPVSIDLEDGRLPEHMPGYATKAFVLNDAEDEGPQVA